jgi:hypothetical protein
VVTRFIIFYPDEFAFVCGFRSRTGTYIINTFLAVNKKEIN